MCGICGVVDSKMQGRIDREIIVNMTNKLLHRGPDDVDHYLRDHVAFGFTRLSIIDVSGGMQPLFNEDGTIMLVCNGEIFNYIELRDELIAKGHIFRTNTDVEVILHLYEEYQADFINRLNGQFAFALYDYRSQTLLCARDHVGIAPFFYTIIDGVFIFASEIKAILMHPKVNREVDLTALDQIMTFPGMRAPRTLFKDIYCLENGHYLKLYSGGKLEVNEYWDLNYPKTNEIQYIEDEDYYTERLDDLLGQSIKRRLQSDVPVGFYISGGLDSSLVGAKISQIDRGRRRNSFSLDFTEKDISESKYQRLMSSYINSNHHERLFHFHDMCNTLEKAVYHSECALKETYNTASLALSELVRNQGIKVILSGEGADELFGGYVGYKFDKFRQFQPKVTNSDTIHEDEIRRKLWGDENFIYEKNYYSYQRQKQQLYSSTINQDYDRVNCLNYPIIDNSKINDRDILHKRSYIDFKLRLSEHLLADHGDRMAFANSVEGRYPFLDKELIEFSRIIPPHLKLKEFNEKYILKKIASKLIPEQIIKRPKFAFVAPGSPAMLKKNVEFINDILSYDVIKKQGYFNPDIIEVLKKQYIQNDFQLNLPFDSDLLIIAITFGIFLNKFDMPNL